MSFFKNKPIDCYKKINKLVYKMYYLKKTLILKANFISDKERQSITSQLSDIIDVYNGIVNMEFNGAYLLMKRDIMRASYVVDYECKKLSLLDFIDKVYKEIENIKRISKGAPVRMSVINPNSISEDFFYDEHKLGVYHSLYLNSPDYKLPPMFYV